MGRRRRLKVEIWSDVVCPWCYIGKRRFETALAGFDGAADVEVTWRSFQLNPKQPRGTRTTHGEYLRAKIGGSLEQVQAMNDRVTTLAAAEGLDYHFERYQVINTFDAHRVAHLGRVAGLGDAIQERLLRGQLVEGEVLDDPDTLVRLGEEVGLAGDEIRDVLATDRYAAEVNDDIREAGELGITGVPFFVVDRRYGISGAQPAELLLQALTMARAEAMVMTGG
jgi:predicted DsbA family dithiol-disulfide isomerase